MTRFIIIAIILILFLTGCKQDPTSYDIKDVIDHWEIIRTFKTYINSSIQIDTVDNEFKVVDGYNDVLIISIERNPIFKEGKRITDAYSSRSLLIELDSTDTIVTAKKPSNSKLFRNLIAFSPNYGIKPLHLDEKITLTRTDSNTWIINSELIDFIFNGVINFSSNQILVDKFNDY